MSLARRLIGLFLLFSTHFVFAGPYLDNLREDLLVPAHCRTTTMAYFFRAQDIQYITYGVRGAQAKGFTYEVPLTRNQMASLWRAFSHPSEAGRILQQNPELAETYRLIYDHASLMDIDWQVEGEILEVLAVIILKQLYPAPQYYVTGGVEYHLGANSRTLGELDLMVGDASNCQIFVVGEAKLGTHRLSKAQEQLRRFYQFLLKCQERGAN